LPFQPHPREVKECQLSEDVGLKYHVAKNFIKTYDFINTLLGPSAGKRARSFKNKVN
jgi:hypothetical protein